MISQQSHIPVVASRITSTRSMSGVKAQLGNQGLQAGQFAQGILGKYGMGSGGRFKSLNLVFRHENEESLTEVSASTRGAPIYQWFLQIQIVLQQMKGAHSFFLLQEKQLTRQIEQWLGSDRTRLAQPMPFTMGIDRLMGSVRLAAVTPSVQAVVAREDSVIGWTPLEQDRWIQGSKSLAGQQWLYTSEVFKDLQHRMEQSHSLSVQERLEQQFRRIRLMEERAAKRRQSPQEQDRNVQLRPSEQWLLERLITRQSLHVTGQSVRFHDKLYETTTASVRSVPIINWVLPHKLRKMDFENNMGWPSRRLAFTTLLRQEVKAVLSDGGPRSIPFLYNPSGKQQLGFSSYVVHNDRRNYNLSHQEVYLTEQEQGQGLEIGPAVLPSFIMGMTMGLREVIQQRGLSARQLRPFTAILRDKDISSSIVSAKRTTVWPSSQPQSYVPGGWIHRNGISEVLKPKRIQGERLENTVPIHTSVPAEILWLNTFNRHLSSAAQLETKSYIHTKSYFPVIHNRFGNNGSNASRTVSWVLRSAMTLMWRAPLFAQQSQGLRAWIRQELQGRAPSENGSLLQREADAPSISRIGQAAESVSGVPVAEQTIPLAQSLLERWQAVSTALLTFNEPASSLGGHRHKTNASSSVAAVGSLPQTVSELGASQSQPYGPTWPYGTFGLPVTEQWGWRLRNLIADNTAVSQVRYNNASRVNPSRNTIYSIHRITQKALQLQAQRSFANT